MRRSAALVLLGVTVASAAIVAVLVVAGRRSTDPAARILSAFQEDRRYAGLKITYPLDETLFPPEIVAPTFRWQDDNDQTDAWLVAIRFPGGQQPINVLCRAAQWRPLQDRWQEIKDRSLGKKAEVFVLGVNLAAPQKILSGGTVSIGTSEDEAGAPILYREVILPFIDAVKDPSRICWRLGDISSQERPPIVLENLPVCGNCHSFSADGNVLGMDIDYANSKGSYAILPVAEEMVLHTSRIITWDDYEKEENELSFGLLSQVSPDGKYVISTVKDQSVFVPRPDLAFSQLFFPIRGILAYYDREAESFHALPGADDRELVHSNPSWSPDGEYIVFARGKAYTLNNLRDRKATLLTREECSEFLDGHQTFKYDLYRIPFNRGIGGKAEPLQGASNNGMSNYFARYSPDGKWIVFCRAESFMLLQPDSQLYIIPAEGGEARNLRCNTSRMNSWHSWSPNGRWLVFSSKANSVYTQLFLTHIDPQGRSSPAVLLAQFTAEDRAANIPEFVNVDPGGIKRIREQFLDDYSFVRAGDAFIKQRDLDGAARAYAKAVELNPENAAALANLGVCLSDKGEYKEAETHFRKAAELQPESEDVQRNLGLVLARQRRFPEAVRYYRKAVQLAPKFVEAHTNLASALFEMGKHDQAIESYRAVLSIQPEHPMAHLELGRLLLRRDQFSLAQEHLAAAIAIAPKLPQAHYYLGRTLYVQGDVAEALQNFRSAVELNPKLVQALNDLAWICATDSKDQIRNGPEAVALAERASELTQEKVPAILDTLAAAYAEAGDFRKAVATATQAKLLAAPAGDAALAKAIDGRLKLYLAGKPFHEPSP